MTTQRAVAGLGGLGHDSHPRFATTRRAASSGSLAVPASGPTTDALPGPSVRLPLTAGLAQGARVAADPYRMARDLPDRWMRYCRDHFRSDIETAWAFGVCERTARKWRQGLGGCNGDKVAMAVRHHPASAPAYLFAAE